MPTITDRVKNIRPHGKSRNLSKWSKMLIKATDQDRLEQEHMAVLLYEKLHKDLEMFAQTGKSEVNDAAMEITSEQKDIVQKTSYCILCRINKIKLNNSSNWMTLNDMKKLKPLLKDILSWRSVFPVLIEEIQSSSKVSLLSSTDSGLGEVDSSDEESDEEDIGEHIVSRLRKVSGFTRMSLKIDKIGLKDTDLIEPYLSISVRDSDSVHLTQVHHIPAPKKVEDFHLHFDTRIEVQRYIEKIPKGSHVFIELKHNKQGKIKTKCFAVLKRSEFRTNKGFLELYKGPPDYHMKKLEKLTQKKPLFLHIDIKLHD